MLYISDFEKQGYPVGTFKMGQRIYCIENKEHYVLFHKECKYCNSTGYVLIKNDKFICPACKGEYTGETTVEKIVKDYATVQTVISMNDGIKKYEIYTTQPNGRGMPIFKFKNAENIYFPTREKAQTVCDKYNKKHNAICSFGKNG